MLRLLSFTSARNAKTRVGLMVSPETVLDLSLFSDKLKAPAAFADMLSLIESGDDTAKWLHQAREIAEKDASSASVASSVVSLREVKVLAPIPVPRRNIFCIGKNYRDHIAEVAAADKKRGIGSTSAAPKEGEADKKQDKPEGENKYAQFFTKATTTVIGPNAAVESHPTITQWLDYEAELAVIIGKPGRDISRENALSHVFGYSIANDITSRDVQRKHNQWFRGKSLDTTCPLGPYILHSSSLVAPNTPVNPQNLDIKLWLNGELRQSSNTNNMIFDIGAIIEQLSAGLTLLPGDIILTGTPSGVGYAMKPPQVLKAGDNCVVEIEHIGRLENNVV